MKITIRLDIEQCDIPVRGNGGGKETEDEILARLDRGDVFAWFDAIVEARAEVQGETFIGRDSLGGCSYRDLEDFKVNSGYYEDMKQAAINDLKESMIAAEKRASAAARGLIDFAQGKVEVEEVE